MSREPITAIVFDKDGTLFDFMASWGQFTVQMITSLAGDDRAQQARLEKALGYDMAAGKFARDSISIAGTAAEVASAIRTVMPERPFADLLSEINQTAGAVPLVPAAPLGPFLEELKARGMALGVATNDAEAPARTHLSRAGVEAEFDFIAGYDSGHGAKPGAGPLLAFARSVGRAPASCAMVGDSLHDLHAARAAGMVAVGVLTGVADHAELAPAADVVLSSIAGIPDWLDTL